MRLGRLISFSAALTVVLTTLSPAVALEWPKQLRPGAEGPAVRRLQMRIAGWYPRGDQTFFSMDGTFGRQTERALERFQDHYGLKVDGAAGAKVFALLDALEDPDGSTAHFDWSEFWQKRSSGCGKKANSFAGTFEGGLVDAKTVKRNVRRLMWRLEALRAKLGDKPIAINSGFRSVAYNACLNGATQSQHQFGTAADLRVVGVDNRAARGRGKWSQMHGIACYHELTHNHFDLRLHNHHLPSSRHWWWPERDSKGRDLDESGRPCWGEGSAGADGRTAAPSHEDLRQWQGWGEPPDLLGLD